MGEAALILQSELTLESERIKSLRDLLEQRLETTIPGMTCNGDMVDRLPGNSSVTLPGVEGSALIANLRNVTISSGSACNSSSTEPSHVLTAIGLAEDAAARTIRFGIGRYNSTSDIERACTYVAEAWEGIAEALSLSSSHHITQSSNG
jgi:cysteine desulfurase